MADYGEITSIIPQMKRFAIDAFMGQQGWIPDIEYDDRYALWGFVPSWYARPDENGEGGGERIGPGWDSLASGFDNIRARIDAATGKWLHLPSGEGASTPRDAMNAVAAQFGAAASGGTAIADNEVSKSIDTISNTVVSNIFGSFKAPFLDKYDAQFSKVIGSTGSAVAILQTAYAAELAIWPAARQDAVNICDSVRNAFGQRAGQAVDEVRDVLLGVVGAVTGVVTTIASAGTAAPIVTLVGLANTAANAVKSVNAAIDIAEDSYDSIMASLEAASDHLNTVVRTQEDAIATMVSDATAYIASDQPSFDLDAYQLRDFSTTGELIKLEQSEADTVRFNMDRLSEALASAASTLAPIPGSGFLARNGDVGLGANGPYAQITALHDLVTVCLNSTRDEYARGRELFVSVVNDYFATDDESELVAQALERELDESTP